MQDKVIRRDIAVNPGEVFNLRKVRVSVQRLVNLNYFGDPLADPRSPEARGVMWRDRPTDVEGVSDLIIEVKERPTGRLWFGDIYAKGHFMLGKIYEQRGMTAEAIRSYRTFLDLWQEADSTAPDIEEAKRALADLLR